MRIGGRNNRCIQKYLERLKMQTLRALTWAGENMRMPRDGQKPEMSRELSDSITKLILKLGSGNIGSVD